MKTKVECLELLHNYFQNVAKHYGIVRMGLFGSVVRNEQTESSDIDIVYEGKPDILLRSRMKQELEALLGCKVDIVRLRKQLSGSAFEKSISKDLIYV
ncbi:nucleotidyltransferase family protein [Parabacteroides bouchesdurhonensis]|uniref:nucleotidyltransferase family protein n=1 Tax=Parabacteroides bouchesdurhonensis TaxID=1936995 RepID=UPI000C824348|nr:nucleotidyltransferase domain-containing protein [Parabacteroides bouchesdurhonensis]